MGKENTWTYYKNMEIVSYDAAKGDQQYKCDGIFNKEYVDDQWLIDLVTQHPVAADFMFSPLNPLHKRLIS